MSREQQLQRWLFECLPALNTRKPMHIDTIKEGLSKCICSSSPTIAAKAAQQLARITNAPVVVKS